MTLRHSPLPTRTQPANSWSSWSCPTLVIVLMSRSGAQTVTSTPAISSSRLNLESIFLGVEGVIGSRSSVVSGVTPGKSPQPGAHRPKTFIIDQFRSIEDNVRATCGELVFECVVVGNGRPSPALFVEASEKCTIDSEELREEIVRRMRQFHSRRFIHEQITTEHIVVVERGTLPRTATKGNVRRQAVEDQYKELLDSIYSTVPKS